MPTEKERQRVSYAVFVCWLVAVVAGYGVLWLFTSGELHASCRGVEGDGFCWSDRDELTLAALLVGSWIVPIEAGLGVLATHLYTKRHWSAFTTGTLAFFSTAPLTGTLFAYLSFA
ncbi:hypothetical protein AB0E69_39950 [Kribbella sp. NPDC026611]|uniref:hypothetical protein n=1 Tax=Kribbella sp. NPDC026611 TaxID=3154911 RepID=UPI0034003712